MWHRPRFSSGSVHGNATGVQPLWTIAYTGGVDVVLNGHEHVYERFAPQNVGGKLDDEFGVREFVVGTGGYYLYELGDDAAQQRDLQPTYGVLKLKLHADELRLAVHPDRRPDVHRLRQRRVPRRAAERRSGQ